MLVYDNDIKIIDIYWHNIYLHVKLSGDNLENYEFAIASDGNRFVYPIDAFDVSSGEIVINITNLGNQKMLENGVWFIKYKNTNYAEQMAEYEKEFAEYQKNLGRSEINSEDIPMAPMEWENIPITFDVGYSLKNMDKVYRYSGTSYAYVFSFAAVSKREQLVCSITCTYMVKTNNPEKRYFRIESAKLGARAKKRLIYFLENVINWIYQVVSRITPKDGTRVLLMSETRAPITGNLKALDDRIKERGLNKTELKMSYWFRKTLAVNRFKILLIWLRLAFITARQDYIFVDDYCPFFNNVKVSPKTKLIQVWHAGVGFKSVGYARFGTKGTPKPTHCCHRQYDYAIVGGESLRDVYSEVFGIDKENCLPYGLMRLDNYLAPERIAEFKDKFYNKYPDFAGKKIILFAPTFRGASQRTSYYPYEMLDWQKIYDMCGDEYLFIIKQHPFIPERVHIEDMYCDRIIDFSSFPDINELFYVTDILITDYSSNIYEFSLHRKPIIFFVFDKEEYELTRGVHRTIDEYAPGKICKTFDEVSQAIVNKDFDIEKTYRFVEDNFDLSEGLSSDKVIDNIILKNLK